MSSHNLFRYSGFATIGSALCIAASFAAGFANGGTVAAGNSPGGKRFGLTYTPGLAGIARAVVLGQSLFLPLVLR